VKEAQDLRIGKGISWITVYVSKEKKYWLVAGLGNRQATSHPVAISHPVAARLQDDCLDTR
jgi:hypothetical protein